MKILVEVSEIRFVRYIRNIQKLKAFEPMYIRSAYYAPKADCNTKLEATAPGPHKSFKFPFFKSRFQIAAAKSRIPTIYSTKFVVRIEFWGLKYHPH